MSADGFEDGGGGGSGGSIGRVRSGAGNVLQGSLAALSPFALLSRARSLIQSMGWTGLGQSIIGSVVLGWVAFGMEFLRAMFSVPIVILRTIGVDLAFLNSSFIRGIAVFVNQTILSGAASFGTGWTGLLGPLQTPFGVAVGLLALWEVLYFLDITDSDAIGFVLDLPELLGFGTDESDVADDDEEE